MECVNTCGQCRHWHAKPKPEPRPGQAVVISSEQQARGDCRCMPPSASVTFVQSGGRMQQIVTSIYPDLVESTPVCGQFQARLEVRNGCTR